MKKVIWGTVSIIAILLVILFFQYLKKRGSRPGLEGSLPELSAMDTLCNQRFSDFGPWRDLPPKAIHSWCGTDAVECAG